MTGECLTVISCGVDAEASVAVTARTFLIWIKSELPLGFDSTAGATGALGES
jgi:hypothetical protein